MLNSQALNELVGEALLILQEINKHPQYKALQKQGYSPDLNIADAVTALEYLTGEIDND
jgi:hypothetical protein